MANEENVQNQTDDIDALYDSIMNGSREDAGLNTEKTQTAASTPPPSSEPPSEFEFQWNGKQIKADREKVLKWASQGYDYSQKMAEFNRRMQEVDGRYSKAEELYNKYGAVDEWVQQNQDKWEALQKAISGAEASGASPELLQKLHALEAKLNESSKFIDTIKEREELERQAKEDSELDAEIKSIQEKYKDLDWNTANEEGKTLEYRVLEHADKNRINSFKAAFHDLMHDELVKLAEMRGRETLTKERQAKQSQGLLGKTEAPKAGLTKPTGLKKKSYDDLAREGLEELGITL